MPSGGRGVDWVNGKGHTGARDTLSFIPDPHSVVVDKGVVGTHRLSRNSFPLGEELVHAVVQLSDTSLQGQNLPASIMKR
jgi:hypothetical protein